MWIRQRIISVYWITRMANKISAVILAAGMSRRMGRPKMLLPWRNTTVLGQVVTTFHQAGIQDIIVVTGGDKAIVESEVERLAYSMAVRSVYNPDFEIRGMMTSIQTGIKALATDFEAVLIGLGDQPQVEITTIKNLLDHFHKAHGSIIIPSHNQRRGHPILLDRNHSHDLMLRDPSSSLRDFLNLNQDKINYIDAGESILQDLDTPQDYQQYHKA